MEFLAIGFGCLLVLLIGWQLGYERGFNDGIRYQPRPQAPTGD